MPSIFHLRPGSPLPFYTDLAADALEMLVAAGALLGALGQLVVDQVHGHAGNVRLGI